MIDEPQHIDLWRPKGKPAPRRWTSISQGPPPAPVARTVDPLKEQLHLAKLVIEAGDQLATINQKAAAARVKQKVDGLTLRELAKLAGPAAARLQGTGTPSKESL